jgi:hypothetical protein
MAALLALCYAALALDQRALCAAVVAGGLNGLAIGREEKDVQAHVDAGLAARLRERFRRHVGTAEGDIPAVRLAADGDGLGGARYRARPAHGDPPDFA